MFENYLVNAFDKSFSKVWYKRISEYHNCCHVYLRSQNKRSALQLTGTNGLPANSGVHVLGIRLEPMARMYYIYIFAYVLSSKIH